MIKKEYKKPKIVFEDLAFKSALATCGSVSTTKIESDIYPCIPGEGDKAWGVPTYVEEFFGAILFNDNENICSMPFECYHAAVVEFDGKTENYIGLS